MPRVTIVSCDPVLIFIVYAKSPQTHTHNCRSFWIVDLLDERERLCAELLSNVVKMGKLYGACVQSIHITTLPPMACV